VETLTIELALNTFWHNYKAAVPTPPAPAYINTFSFSFTVPTYFNN